MRRLAWRSARHVLTYITFTPRGRYGDIKAVMAPQHHAYRIWHVGLIPASRYHITASLQKILILRREGHDEHGVGIVIANTSASRRHWLIIGHHRRNIRCYRYDIMAYARTASVTSRYGHYITRWVMAMLLRLLAVGVHERINETTFVWSHRNRDVTMLRDTCNIWRCYCLPNILYELLTLLVTSFVAGRQPRAALHGTLIISNILSPSLHHVKSDDVMLGHGELSPLMAESLPIGVMSMSSRF